MKNLVKLIVLVAVMTLGGSCFAQCNVRCQAAFRFVVSHEDRNLTGVVSPEPFGGYARYGVNSKAHPEATRAGFYRMSKVRALRYAENLFYKQYWSKMNCDQIEDYHLAYRLADLAYNLGPIRATILLQRALNEMGSDLVAKGYLGQETMDALSNQPSPAALVLLKVQAVGFYSRLARKHTVMRAWKKVWMERLAETEEA